MRVSKQQGLDELINLLVTSSSNRKFNSKDFMYKWLKAKGKNYIFIFKKNVSHTNMQYAELLSLLREFVSCNVEEADFFVKSALMFHKSDDFEAKISKSMHDLLSSEMTEMEAATICAKTYYELISHCIVMDSYFCTCNVALPPSLDLDLEKICAASSYIHSCGPSVFIENIDSTNKSIISKKLGDYLKYLSQSNVPVKNLPFIPYTHEDFSPSDVTNPVISEQISNGIDGIKLRINKLNVQNNTLTEVLESLRDDFWGKIDILRREEVEQFKFRGAMWLVTDFKINEQDTRRKGDKQYYICYDQHYFNDSPFDIFDEDKPAWKAHTTTPHLLIGAMINCTKPWNQKDIKIIDPFGGTGTTYFECLRHEGVEVTVSDIDPVFEGIIMDNLEFLAADEVMISECKEKISILYLLLQKNNIINKSNTITTDSIHSLIEDIEDEKLKNILIDIVEPVEILGQVMPGEKSKFIEMKPEQSQKLKPLCLYKKLLFYVLLRTNNRYSTAIGWGAKAHWEAFIDECRIMSSRLDEYRKWMLRQEKRRDPEDENSGLQGKYSYSTSIDRTVLIDKNAKSSELFDRGILRISNALDVDKDTYDVIIADPPYGFNTDKDLGKLVSLYAELIPSLITSLRSNGQLLMCLPMKSYTGKLLPHCALKDFVIPEILFAAEKEGRYTYNSGRMIPVPFSKQLTPYYWVAEKSLGRWILHFQFS